jgi:hypothetical protein
LHSPSNGACRSVYLAAGLALVLCSATALGAAAAQPGGGAKDPLKLFEPMMPVFSDVRCSNCHGGVDVFSDERHGGGALKKDEVPLKDGDMLPGQDGNDACTGCHDEDAENSVWRLAPQRMSFVGKDTLALCKQLRQENGLTTQDPEAFAAFLRHLSGDQLIGFAFEGYRAQTANIPDDAQAPQMDRPTFVNLARRWLQDGKARCGPWDGTISQVNALKNISPLVEEVTDIQTDITVKDGEARANVHMTGHTIQKGQACFYRRDDFTADATDLPIDLNILVARDLLTIPNFQVPGLPAPPQGVPAPPNLFGADTYTFTFRVPDVKGNDHFEERNPPGCGPVTGDRAYSLLIPGVQLAKPLDPQNPDHLHDTDVVQQGPATITTEWDLTR